MTTTSKPSLTVLSPLDVRNAWLRYTRAELLARGVVNPNMTPQSEYAVRAAALSNVISPCMANSVAAAEINMPDTAVDDRLSRWLKMYGMVMRPSQPSTGSIVFSSSATTYVAVGQQLVDDQGQFYQVTAGASYANGQSIPIISISTGASTRRKAGDVLQWLNPPAYANARQIVDVGGLSDGADADTQEMARARLLTRMKRAQGGGNWAQTIAWAENVIAGTMVFDYPAIAGPATYGLWILGQLRWTGSAFSRQISDAARTLIRNAVVSQKPAETKLRLPMPGSSVTSADYQTNVAIALSIPIARSAGGTGGGWTDASPWPLLLGTIANRVTVSTVLSSTNIRVTSNDATTTPDPAGIVDSTTQIAWFDPTSYGVVGGKLIKTSTVIAHTGTVGDVGLTLDPTKPFSGIETGDFIFPNCEQAEAYAAAWLAAMALMGPGEWTSNPTILQQSRRQPPTSLESPSSLGYAQTRAIENSGAEVLSATYLYQQLAAPPVPPSTITTPPRVLVPGRRLGFYLPR